MTKEERDRAHAVIVAIFFLSWLCAVAGAGLLWGAGGALLVGGLVGVVFTIVLGVSEDHRR